MNNHGPECFNLTQYFSENENENHADKQPWLLCCAADTGISNNTDGESKQILRISKSLKRILKVGKMEQE